MSTERKQIQQSVIGLGINQTKNIVCPYCQTRNETSMSVTKERYGILYHCFRAKCSGSSGFIPSLSLDAPIAKAEFTPSRYEYETTALPEACIDLLRNRFGLTEKEIDAAGVRYNPVSNTFVYPIRDVRGYDVGVLDRDYTGNRKPKALVYWFNDVVKLHWCPHSNKRTDSVLIVEDTVSAIKASRYIDTVAILGTGLNASHISEISRLYSNAIIALDNDAFTKAISLKKKYEYYFNELTALYLVKDIKDMKDENIKQLISSQRNLEGL